MLLGSRSALAPRRFESPAHPPAPVSSHLFRRSPIRELDGFLVRSDLPAWKQLINPALTIHERVSVNMAIFADRDKVETIERLCGDDAQTFVNVIDKVRMHALPPRKNWSICPLPNLLHPVG